MEVILTEPSSGAGRGPQSIATQRQREFGVQYKEKLKQQRFFVDNLIFGASNIKLSTKNLRCFYTATVTENDVTEVMTREGQDRVYRFMRRERTMCKIIGTMGPLFNCLG